MKIAALTTVSGAYIVARYSAFTNKLLDSSFFLIELGQVSTTYSWHWNSSLKTPYKRIVLSKQPAEIQSSLSLFSKIAIALDKIQPDILVICGYGVPGMREALLWSLWKNKPAVLLSESKEDDMSRNCLKELFKSLLVRKYQAALVGSKLHGRYLVKLGMSPEAIFYGYDVVGNDDYHPDQIRHLSRLIPKPYFLAINRFITKKNLPFLLDAYAVYRRTTNQEIWDLVICGDGELRPQLERMIARLKLQDCVHLPGFLQQEQLLPYFAHANCFIHASIQEQWGLVVNEAMAAGLPVLVSNRCGCFEDLVIEGINGFGFDPTNQQQLINLMLKVSCGEVNLEKMGQASLKHIQKFSPDYFAQGLIQAIEYAFAHREL